MLRLTAQRELERRKSPGRRERRRVETRERIFRAGLRLFAARGFSGTTVEDITEAADVGKGTFFNYFPSKEHMLAAFGEMQVGKFRAALAEAREGHRSMQEVLRRALHALVEEPGRSAALVRSLMAANFSNETVRRHLQRNLNIGRERLNELAKLAQQRGEMPRSIPSTRLARALQQMFFGGMVLWSLNPDKDLRELQEETFQVIWSGVGVPRQKAKNHKPSRRWSSR